MEDMVKTTQIYSEGGVEEDASERMKYIHRAIVEARVELNKINTQERQGTVMLTVEMDGDTIRTRIWKISETTM
jgi:hypothetical protein